MSKVKTVFYGALVNVTGEKEVEVEASTLGEVLDTLTARWGNRFKAKLLDTTGNIRRFINIYINGKDVRFLNYFDTILKDEDEVLIIPAVSGG
ncbi:MAG: MoaD family protein [Candidatus Methylarchaceae archaeon HK01B]|nr:MoaD family protein [Candidatus Methylarchaceae archaeon HK01M]MCP8312297.1 MoaD family protein [Candidatus Methylarchaceae archaeon HK02M1]MCP8318798.1 MoaD family protein [Candidatus Methylarchaceae archaeon HK01B]